MKFHSNSFKKLSSTRRKNRLGSASSFGYNYETRRDPFGAGRRRQVQTFSGKQKSKRADANSDSSIVNTHGEAWAENTTIGTEPSNGSGSENRYWKSFRNHCRWTFSRQLGPVATSMEYPSAPHVNASKDCIDVPAGAANPKSLHVVVQDLEPALGKRRQEKLPRKGTGKTTRGESAGSSSENKGRKQDVDFSEDLRHGISNRKMFAWTRKQAPDNIDEQGGRKGDRESAEKGLLNLGLIKLRTKKRRGKQLVLEKIAPGQAVAPDRTKVSHGLTSKFRISSFRSLRNTNKDGEFVGTSGLDLSTYSDTGDNNESTKHMSRVNPDNALLGRLNSRGRSERRENDGFRKKRAGSCPASNRQRSHCFDNQLTPCGRGHGQQTSVDEWRSLTMGSMRSLGYGECKRTGRMSDFESPWGVKGERRLEERCLESRQSSRSFLGVHMSDILWAVNNRLKARREDSDRESDFLVSDDTQEGEEEDDQRKGNKGKCAEIEMFQDPFVEYTMRAKQGSNRTLADRFKRKSTVG